MNPKRSRGLLIAAVALVALLGGALIVLLLHDNGSGANQATPTAAAAPSASGGATASPPAALQQPLTAAPPGVTWQLFQGVALPASTTDGPARVDGAVHSGFSRTPTGALLADAQISTRSLVDPGLAGLRQVAQAQLVDGPGKTAYLNLIAQLTENDPPAAGFAQYAGFRYITFSPDLAVISLATRSKSGVLQVGTDTLRWVDGDWKLEKPASGLQQPQTVQNIAGYVPWSGVS